VRPEDLARELGIDGKRLRGWLRGPFPRRPDEHGLPWSLTEEQVAEARRVFAGARPRSSRSFSLRPAARPSLVAVRPTVGPTSARLSWSTLQRHADGVLAAGLRTLLVQPAVGWGAVDVHGAGVYAFFDDAAALYVGEAIVVSSRIVQHRKLGSAFLVGLASVGGPEATRPRIRALPVDLGRLDLEEFAIACLRPSSNRMRLASRAALAFDDADLDLWARVQADAQRLLREGVRVASDVPSVPWREMQPPSGPGLYIVRDRNGRPVYVGESDALAERLKTHGGSRSYFSALRRHVGTEILGLSFAPDVRRGFSLADEAAISAYLASCSIAIHPLNVGRWELERELVHQLGPQLNREHA